MAGLHRLHVTLLVWNHTAYFLRLGMLFCVDHRVRLVDMHLVLHFMDFMMHWHRVSHFMVYRDRVNRGWVEGGH